MRRLSAAVVCFVSVAVMAEKMPPAFRAEAYNHREPVRRSVATLRFANPDVALEAPELLASPDRDRVRIGIARTLPSPIAIGGPRAQSAESSLLIFKSAGATRVRLHLVDAHLSGDLTVCGMDGICREFGNELLGPDHDIWTPSVSGESVALMFGVSDRFTVTDVVHIYSTAAKPDATQCLSDVTCNTFADKDVMTKSVAQMEYMSGGNYYVCTGGLINAKVTDRLFLTAHHCIGTQSEASSLELRWDYKTNTCAGSTYVNTIQTNASATLLATSATSDVTMLRLGSLPAGRYLLGWDTNRPAVGTTLYRVSHPATDDGTSVYAQVYSTEIVNELVAVCNSVPRPAFLYSSKGVAGISGGSSGSPVVASGGYIVGQLFGICPGTGDGCSLSTSIVDGWLGQSYTLLQPFLSPTTGQCTCTATANVACALGGRFKVSLTWNYPPANLSGLGTIVKYADNLPEVDPTLGPVSESLFFSMYAGAPKSIEVLVRLLNGHGINDKYWIFMTGFTGSEYTTTIQDTRTCATWSRTVAIGATDVVKDFDAFPLP